MTWWMILPPIPLFPGVSPIRVSLFGTHQSFQGICYPDSLSTVTSPVLSGNSTLM